MSRRIFTLLFAAISFIAWVPARAQGSEPPIPERPPQGTYILDTLNWLSVDQESETNEMINRWDKECIALKDCGADKVSYRKSLFQTFPATNPVK